MISIIVPTYNEVENLPHLIERISHMFQTCSIEGEVIIVDDDSPDGTGILAQRLAEKYSDLKMKVLVRKGERGLSSAVIRGFETA
jgi:dolichol-phosphate mannosyltransferase